APAPPGPEEPGSVLRRRGGSHELLEHASLVLPVGEMEGAAALVPDAGRGEHLEPPLPAPRREPVAVAGRLADGPEHAEVPDRRALGARAPLEDRDAPPPPGEMV